MIFSPILRKGPKIEPHTHTHTFYTTHRLHHALYEPGHARATYIYRERERELCICVSYAIRLLVVNAGFTRVVYDSHALHMRVIFVLVSFRFAVLGWNKPTGVA